MSDITLWKPEPDILIHQALGKAGEEAGELATILFRCTIQGLDASESVSGKPTRKSLFDEIADVLAATQWLRDLIGDEFDQARFDRKLAGFRRWQAMLEEDAGHGHCDICAKPIHADDICSTDIELGICHAACLEGSPTVDLETGEPTAGKIDTYRYGDIASPAGNTEGGAHV
ncbi:hypothetical protein TAL182_CH01088 [Rhizobium sp. TAL182]|uniref:hypothetical protein n=1 Tax=Rhizobium sp. TAL182 TaxID=2020313 RepID=UPI000A21059F|nr:hypothetical protein [Rhizobium sp. TAL182]ARO22901.1 hypothetical protein TAL182_CH01088 [Rhizobium sp. TAL182]